MGHGRWTTADFKGFHRLERALYRDNVTDPSAPLLLTDVAFSAWASELEVSYKELGMRISAVRSSVPPAEPGLRGTGIALLQG